MLTRRTVAAFAVATFTLGELGCYQGQPGPSQPATYFNVFTVQDTSSATGIQGTTSPIPGIGVYGSAVNPPFSSPGTVGFFDEFTNDTGVYKVNNAIVPANWEFQVSLPTWCSTVTVPPAHYNGIIYGYEVFQVDSVAMENMDAYKWICNAPISQTPPATSRFAIAGNIPPSVTLTGISPFSSTYGMPILYMYDGANGNPNLAATITASFVNSGGESATFPLPSSLASNAYSLATTNATSSGTYTPNSYNFYSIASSQTIQGNPFGVAVAGMTYASTDTYCYPYWGCWTTRTASYSPVRAVSLYSAGQVLIGNSAVNVGANPTAVAAYASGPVNGSYYYNGGTYTMSMTWSESGQTRAIVANSGSNTVSILDLVNNAVLSTVAVGNHPIALAVSSDGSTAYVANYGDNTVTKINLNTMATTATIAVGGQPTSVALTATGTLWVGGVGFLSQINTQNMSVVATQSTGGMTISALAYTDQENELITTKMDTLGNVNLDEVNPSTVNSNSPYTALASHQVSTLGTYFSPITQTMVRGFTGTLSQSLVPLNTTQAGAPPLVVQDGWAVVSATPTGFTITDTTGHIVLVSETTPSPVAAIAVDPNLNIAYLTMPDSNTVLTVPLPGVGSN